MSLIAIGEILWDVFPSGARLGGAPFNFTAHLARLGHNVAFVSGLAGDEYGARALAEMQRLAVPSRFIHITPEAPTGLVTVSLNAAGEPAYTLHRPAAYDFPALSEADLEQIRTKPPDWVYYGTLAQTSLAVRKATQDLIVAAPNAQRFYDVNLRPGSDRDPGLVEELLRDATFVKLNAEESQRLGAFFRLPTDSTEAFSRAIQERYRLEGVCVTLGSEGCALFIHGGFHLCPGYRIQVHDAVGAGDAFAAALIHGMSSDWQPSQIGDFANRVGALVASRPGAIPEWTVAEALSLAL